MDEDGRDESIPSAGSAARPLFALNPSPIGYPDAVHAVGTVAAPLLAGFSLTAAILVLQSQIRLRWPDAALALLAAAVLAFVTSVQCAFWARQYAVRLSDALGWWPDAEQAYRKEEVEDRVAGHLQAHGPWARRTRLSYWIGLLLLLAALALLLLPPDPLADIHPWRIAGVGVVALGFLYELVWIGAGHYTSRPQAARGFRYFLLRAAWAVAPGLPWNKPQRLGR